MSQHDRDLAEAIHAEISSPKRAEWALSIWDDLATVHPDWKRSQRIRFVLGSIASDAIDTVLARRQREAARTGPWEEA